MDTRRRIIQAFEQFDTQGCRTIEWDSLVRVMKVLNPGYDDQDAQAALLEAGKLRGSTIAYEEFVNWVFGQEASDLAVSCPVIAQEEADEARKIKEMQEKSRRKGMAAQRIDNSEVENYQKPIYAKDDNAKELIRRTLRENDKMKVLVGHLVDNDLEDLINAFHGQEAKKDELVIQQGTEGDRLYIISDGTVDIFVARPDANGVIRQGDKGNKVVSFGPGAMFGELALLYSAPRAATVCVASDVLQLWALEQLDFKMLLAQSAQNQYAMYQGWLREVDLLKTLNYYELSKLSEALESTLYDTGEVIIKQGDPGSTFYILEDGYCSAFIAGPEGEKEVKRYEKQGEYFGELALLSDAPRRATVRATGEGAVVVHLEKEAFVNLLGPLTDILRVHADKYPQYADILRQTA